MQTFAETAMPERWFPKRDHRSSRLSFYRITPLPGTVRFYHLSYATLSWNSSYFACRAVDLATGHKEWEAGWADGSRVRGHP